MKQTQAFKTAYDQLNPAQKQAVDTVEGPVMVIAGPGTGKTQVLTLRIANILLKTQMKPENILALTYTNSGVAAMRQRLVKLIGTPAYRVNIFTFHGFAHYLIQRHPEQFDELLGSNLISELEQIELYESIFSENSFEKIKPMNAPFHYLKPAMQAVSELKRENVSVEEFADILEKQQEVFEAIDDLYYDSGRWEGKMRGKYKDEQKQIERNIELARVYELYEKKREENRFYDYDDLLLAVIDQMEQDEDFLLKQQEQFQYFLLDEHQDTNRAQNRMIELLASFHDNPNVFAVGDEKQAIYRFQGASLTNFLRIKELYPETTIVNLNTNYRSPQRLLDAAHQLMGQTPPPKLDIPLREELTAYGKDVAQAVQLVRSPDAHSEYYFLARLITEALDEGVEPDEMVVLARTNRAVQEAARVLMQQGIPVVLEAKKNVLSDIRVMKLVDLLKAVAHLDDDEKLLRALHVDAFEVHPADIVTLNRFARESKKAAWEVLQHLEEYELTLITPDKLQTVAEKLAAWHTLTHNRPLDEVFTQILHDSGLLQIEMQEQALVDALPLYNTLYEQIKSKLQKEPDYSLEDFLTFLNLLDEHGVRMPASVLSRAQKGVRLMTAHGAKGLEFERVFVLRALDGVWSNRRGYLSFELPYEQMPVVDHEAGLVARDDTVADERRLFYVALTRAQEQVTLLYSASDADGQEQVPAQFVTELGEELVEVKDVSKLEQWWYANQEVLLAPPRSRSAGVDYVAQLTPVVRDLFDRNGLSATALNNFLQCPWRYFFRNLMRLPEAKTSALVFGSAIHQTLNAYVVHDLKWSVEEVLAEFERRLKDEVPADEDMKRMLQEGKEVLPVYYRERMQGWDASVVSEEYISGVGLEPDIKLTGKLDMLVPLDTKGAYRVIDFKTGRPRSRNSIIGKTKSSNGDYYRQLVFYQLLMDRYRGGLMRMKEGVIEFVKPKDNGDIRSEAFVVGRDETEELEEVILEVAESVRNLDFWEKRCEDYENGECEYCQLREYMG